MADHHVKLIKELAERTVVMSVNKRAWSVGFLIVGMPRLTV